MSTLRICIVALLVSSCGKKESDTADEAEKQGVFPFNLQSLIINAVPPGLQSSGSGASWIAKSREVLFHSSQGKITSMATSFDQVLTSIQEVRDGLAADPKCLTAEPASRSILTPDGEAFALSLQCHIDLPNQTLAFWGKDAEGRYSIYARTSIMIGLARIDPNQSGSYDSDVYFSSNYQAGTNTSGSVAHIQTNSTTKTIKLSFAGPDEICGLRLTADSTYVDAEGSVSLTTADLCPTAEQGRFDSQNLTALAGFDNTRLIPEALAFRRLSGTQTTSGIARTYQEYGNTAGSGNTNLMQVGNPNIGARDINFGPAVSNELIDQRFE